MLLARLRLAAPCSVLPCFSTRASESLRVCVAKAVGRWGTAEQLHPILLLPCTLSPLQQPKLSTLWRAEKRYRNMSAHRDPVGSWPPTLGILGHYGQGMDTHISKSASLSTGLEDLACKEVAGDNGGWGALGRMESH